MNRTSDSRSPVRGRERQTLILPLLLWVLALSHRIFLILGSVDRSWPFPIFYEGDAETFYNYAQAILSGSVYDAGVPFHPPLFPYFLAFFHAVLGEPVPNLALRILLAAVFSLQAPLLWTLLRRYVSPGAALAGTLLLVYSFGLSVISIAAVSEGLYLLLLLGALILFRDLGAPQASATAPGATSPRRPHPGASGRLSLRLRPMGLGLLLGLAALTRAEGLGVAVLLLGWGLLAAWRRSRELRPWALAGLTLVLTLAPWTVRNAVTLSRVNRMTAAEGLEPLPTFVVSTAYGPLNFALANHAGAPGYFSRKLLTSGLHEGVLSLRDPQHREYFLHGYRRGGEFIRTQPGAFLELAVRKLAILGRSLHLGWTQWDLPGGLRGTRYPVDQFAPDSALAVLLHLLLLLPGIWLLVRRGADWLRLTGWLVLLTVLTTVAYFGYVRQGVLLLPFVFGIEGVALAEGAGRIARRLPPAWIAPLGALGRPPLLSRTLMAILALLWAVEFGGAFQGRNFVAAGETLAGSSVLNRDSILVLRPARP